MRTYELMYVIDPRVSEKEAEEVNDAVRKLVTGNGAEITKEDDWGRRKLAYPIEKQTEGRYMLMYLHAEKAFQGVAELEHRLEQSDKILRYLTVRTDTDLKRAYGEVTPELAAGMTNGDGDEPKEEEA
jgi:small subunit ribosomal protein S6